MQPRPGQGLTTLYRKAIALPLRHHTNPNFVFSFSFSSVQCFDAVGWAAGRESGL